MAQLTYFQAIDMTEVPTWTGEFVVTEPTVFGVQGQSNAAVYSGAFQYSDDGVISGVITSYDLFRDATLEAQVTGISFDATVVQQLLSQGDHAPIQAAALEGNDVIRGSFEADQLIGLDGDDLIYGLSGDDTLLGGAGSDTLVGGPGNDTLIGGDGLDFAQFAGTVDQYSASRDEDGVLQINDAIAVSRDGNNALEGIERLRFADGDLALDIDGVAGEAYRIYKAAFNRQPDAPGLGFWIDKMDGGATVAEVSEGFLTSQEFQQLYGVSPSDEQFIDLLYENVLQRTPDQSGYDFWISSMDEGVSRAQVLADFSESAENVANVAPEIANGIFYTPFMGE
ncbi:MAG TPA: DUF4214 domain-containing protein [Orrella sp.]